MWMRRRYPWCRVRRALRRLLSALPLSEGGIISIYTYNDLLYHDFKTEKAEGRVNVPNSQSLLALSM